MKKFLWLLLLLLSGNNTQLLCMELEGDSFKEEREAFEYYCRYGMSRLICYSEKYRNKYEQLRKLVLAYIQRPEIDVNELCSGAYVRTSLGQACSYDDLEIVKILLSRDDINVNSKRSRGFTALMDAAVNSRPEIVQLLLEHFADPNIQSDDGNTALYYACLHRRLHIVRLLLDHPNINSQLSGWEMPPFFAARCNIALLREFIDSGKVTWSLKNDDNQTLYYVGFMNNVFDGFESLDDDSVKSLASAQLHKLVRIYRDWENTKAGINSEGIDKFIAFCIEQGADLTEKNKHGKRPLDTAYDEYMRFKGHISENNYEFALKEKIYHSLLACTPSDKQECDNVKNERKIALHVKNNPQDYDYMENKGTKAKMRAAIMNKLRALPDTDQIKG